MRKAEEIQNDDVVDVFCVRARVKICLNCLCGEFDALGGRCRKQSSHGGGVMEKVTVCRYLNQKILKTHS